MTFTDSPCDAAWHEATIEIGSDSGKSAPAKKTTQNSGKRNARGAQLQKRACLRSCGNTEYREDMWYLYCEAESEARKFAQWGNWYPIIRVDCNKEGRAVWIGDGKEKRARIDIPENPNDKGVIFHEVFHSSFHECPLWKNKQNQEWGDAFCDAFRYFMEKKHNKGSAWLNAAEASLERGGRFDQKTEWPSAIIRHCERDYNKLKTFWRERNRRSGESLRDFFAKRQ